MQSGVRASDIQAFFAFSDWVGLDGSDGREGKFCIYAFFYLIYMHSVIFIFVLLQIFFFVFYIIPFLTFKAAGRGPKVAARGGKCLLRSRNVAGIEILQSFSSMKWGRMFFYSNVA